MATKKTNKNSIKKPPKENNKFKIVCISTLIIVLLLSLLLVLNISNKVKSESEKIMENFYNTLSSSSLKTIIYYKSVDDDKKGDYEFDYLNQISKDYNIDFLEIDCSKLNDKNRKEIEDKLGIKGENPTTIVVQNDKVVAVQEGFVESNRYVEFLIEAKVLKEGSKFSRVDNITFINYGDYIELLKKKDKSVIVVGQSGCEYCIASKTTLNNISKGYKITINYIDVTEFNNKQLTEFFDELPKRGYDNEALVNDDSFGMPTLLIIEDGKIKSYLEGVHSLEEYVSYFKENKIIG